MRLSRLTKLNATEPVRPIELGACEEEFQVLSSMPPAPFSELLSVSEQARPGCPFGMAYQRLCVLRAF